jgi:hypothetical protein
MRDPKSMTFSAAGNGGRKTRPSSGGALVAIEGGSEDRRVGTGDEGVRPTEIIRRADGMLGLNVQEDKGA